MGKTLEEVAIAGVHIAQALAPIGEFEVKAIGDLAQVIDEIPVPVLTALGIALLTINLGLKGFNAYVAVTTTYTKIMNTLFGETPAKAEAAAVATRALATAEEEASTQADGAKAGLGKFASFIGAGGPWGLAIGAATILFGAFITQHEEQKQKVDDLVTALGELDSAYKNIDTDGGKSLDSLVAQNTELQKLILNAHTFGITLSDIGPALEGDPAAQQKVLDGYDAELAALQRLQYQRQHAGQYTQASDFTAANVPVPKDFNSSGFISSDNQIANDIDAVKTGRDALKQYTDAATQAAAAQKLVNDAELRSLGVAQNATPAQKALALAISTIYSTSSSASDKLDALKTAEDQLSGKTANAQQAQEDFNKALLQTADGISANGTALNITSQAGIANTDNIKNAIQVAKDQYNNAVSNANGNEKLIDEAKRHYDDQTKAIVDNATKLGIDHDQVQALVDVWDKVPKNPTSNYTITGTGFSDVLSNLQQLRVHQLSLQQGITLSKAEIQYRQDEKSTLGAHAAFAGGGLVTGPGTPTSDSFLIRASNREYMQPAHAVDYYGVGLMEALRTHAIPREAIAGYAAGGLIKFPVDESRTQVPTIAQALAAIGGAHVAPPSDVHFLHFDSGGYLPPGITVANNGTGRNEAVFTSPEPVRTGSAGAGGRRGVVQIDNFYATPSQSPADIAYGLDWLQRGAGGR